MRKVVNLHNYFDINRKMNIQLKTLTMKTKIILLTALISLSFTSCIKDYVGQGPNGKDVELTSENYLDAGVLHKIVLDEELIAVETTIEIKKNELSQLSPNDPKYQTIEDQITELFSVKEDLKAQIANIKDLGSVGLNIPIPCDKPNGKCIPRLLEYFAFLKKDIFRAAVSVKNDTGKNIGFSTKLVDLPGYSDEIQYIRIPVTDYEEQITVEIASEGPNGINKTRFSLTLGK